MEKIAVDEIVIRCDASDVHRWKSVCRSWMSELGTEQFALAWWRQHRSNQPQILLNRKSIPKPVTVKSYEFIEEGYTAKEFPVRNAIQILCSSNGYICGMESPVMLTFYECGSKHMDEHLEDKELEDRRPVTMNLVVGTLVSWRNLPPLVIVAWSTFVKMVVDPVQGSYKIGVMSNSSIAIYDSQVGKWLRGPGNNKIGRESRKLVDFTKMDLGSCIYMLHVENAYAKHWDLYAYDLDDISRLGCFRVPGVPENLANLHSRAFFYGGRLFYARSDTCIVILELKHGEWIDVSKIDVLECGFGNRRLLPEVRFKVEGQLLIVAFVTGGMRGRMSIGESYYPPAVYNLQKSTWYVYGTTG